MRRNNMERRMNTGNNSGGGSLMTGHLQDIDLELELLKRKREMIEQQQQLLVMEQQFKSGRRYDSYDNHGSGRDYTHLYDNGTGSNSRNQFGRKRQPEPQWQFDGSSPKRTRPKRKRETPFAPGQGYAFGPSPRAKGPMPLMGVKIGNKPSIGQKIANQKSSPKPLQQKEFNPNKVSKPKPSPAPNKIASQPVAERKKLVTAAQGSTGEVDVSHMLLPDRVPTQQVSGRLELALGAIMKNIREKIIDIGPNGPLLRSFQSQRVMKQAVRERIRTVMLGKVVGSLAEILAIYREEFPEDTDMDIANMALEASGIPSSGQEKSKFIPSENPEAFFRLNMNCLMDLQLNEMFTNLEDLYAGKTPTLKTEEELAVALKETVEKRNEPRDLEEYKTLLNTDVKPKDFVKILPRFMKRHIPFIIKLLNVNSMYQSTKAAITTEATQKASKKFNKIPTNGTQGQGDGKNTIVDPNAPKEVIRPVYNLPYYVKIMGKPSLPKRKQMETFLSQFNPKSIKKHRTIHNLLFVGFTEKSDFDLMVGADGTRIAKFTLSVRVCTNNNNKDSSTAQNGGPNNSDVSMEDIQAEVQKHEPKSEGDVITAELDGQISDLLSSIRQEEEDKVVDTGDNSADISNGGKEPNDKQEEANEAITHEKTNQKEGDANKEIENENIEETDNQDNPAETNDDALLNDNATNEAETADNAPDDFINEDTGDDNNTTEENEFFNMGQEQPEHDIGSLEGDVINTTESSEVTKEGENDTNNVEENNSELTNIENEAQDTVENVEKVAELKSSGKSTPSRTSARLGNVTPSTIRTRRASRLTQN